MKNAQLVNNRKRMLKGDEHGSDLRSVRGFFLRQRGFEGVLSVEGP